jgi:ribonuclease HI
MVSKTVVGVTGEVNADQNFCFIFVPGHAGVRGNERADYLAGTDFMESGQSMNRSDILHAIKEACRENDSSKDI